MLARQGLSQCCCCCCGPRPDFSTLRNVLRVPGSSGPSTAADAEGDNDPEQSYGSSIVVLALGTLRHHHAASGSFLFLYFLALGFTEGKESCLLHPWEVGANKLKLVVGAGGGGAGAGLSLSSGCQHLLGPENG